MLPPPENWCPLPSPRFEVPSSKVIRSRPSAPNARGVHDLGDLSSQEVVELGDGVPSSGQQTAALKMPEMLVPVACESDPPSSAVRPRAAWRSASGKPVSFDRARGRRACQWTCASPRGGARSAGAHGVLRRTKRRGHTSFSARSMSVSPLPTYLGLGVHIPRLGDSTVRRAGQGVPRYCATSVGLG